MHSLPDSLIVFVSAVVIAFNNFLFIEAGGVLVKALAKKRDVSVLTDGFLLFKASNTSSSMASKVVYKSCKSIIKIKITKYVKYCATDNTKFFY